MIRYIGLVAHHQCCFCCGRLLEVNHGSLAIEIDRGNPRYEVRYRRYTYCSKAYFPQNLEEEQSVKRLDRTAVQKSNARKEIVEVGLGCCGCNPGDLFRTSDKFLCTRRKLKVANVD